MVTNAFDNITRKMCGLMFGVLASLGGTVSANANQDLQEMDCAWWGVVTEFVYKDYTALLQSNDADPIASLKLRMDYTDYHALSAGREMLDVAFAGLDAGLPLWVSRKEVGALCRSFPAKAVDPLNVYAPARGVEA